MIKMKKIQINFVEISLTVLRIGLVLLGVAFFFLGAFIITLGYNENVLVSILYFAAGSLVIISAFVVILIAVIIGD